MFLAHRANPTPIAWDLPSLVVPHIQLSTPSFFAVSTPLVVLSMGLGNVQRLGLLSAQGYRVRANMVTLVLGLNSIVNAVFRGHTAIVPRNGMPITAGPVEGRYWANVISAALTLLIALAAAPVALMLGSLPSGYVWLLQASHYCHPYRTRWCGAKLRFGAVVAFVVSASTFSVLGIGAGF